MHNSPPIAVTNALVAYFEAAVEPGTPSDPRFPRQKVTRLVYLVCYFLLSLLHLPENHCAPLLRNHIFQFIGISLPFILVFIITNRNHGGHQKR